ncbi:MAG: hypothetical protein PHX08_23610, partial [Lachnospiraceae bacterium]|nr:hypothetical protein [Lachnospiraceae bacterium]
KSCEFGITKAEAYKESLIRNCLYRAAVFSSKQCEREGSFGYGKEVALTEEDVNLMEEYLK